MAMTLITTATADNDSTVSFTSGIDSTYKLYVFKFYDCNPTNDTTEFAFQGSIDGGSNYNVTITSTVFSAVHTEDDGTASLSYITGNDLAQGTGFQEIARNVGNGADEHCAGELFLFNPSNTTYVKHFYSTVNSYTDVGIDNCFSAGYFNDTNDIDAIQFKMMHGTFDGTISLYGVG